MNHVPFSISEVLGPNGPGTWLAGLPDLPPVMRENEAVDGSGMTRAVVATAFGGPEVLSVIQTPVSPPGPGEVLISVRAAGTNPIDYKSTAAPWGVIRPGCRCAWGPRRRAW